MAVPLAQGRDDVHRGRRLPTGVLVPQERNVGDVVVAQPAHDSSSEVRVIGPVEVAAHLPPIGRTTLVRAHVKAPSPVGVEPASEHCRRRQRALGKLTPLEFEMNYPAADAA